ncbi:MAG: methyltransferase domain-containing protein [Vicinamibacterales bacterium]
MFLRKTKAREPLPITMTGVRMGERLLQIGVDDPDVAGAIAAKVGLSGSAAVAVRDESGAARARTAAARAGALIDVSETSLEALPYPDASFDVVVVHGIRVAVGERVPGVSVDALKQCLRVLRPGGRMVVITPGPKSGLGALLRPSPATPANVAAEALTAAGFRPVRVVGELEGLRFTEGLKA